MDQFSSKQNLNVHIFERKLFKFQRLCMHICTELNCKLCNPIIKLVEDLFIILPTSLIVSLTSAHTYTCDKNMSMQPTPPKHNFNAHAPA